MQLRMTLFSPSNLPTNAPTFESVEQIRPSPMIRFSIVAPLMKPNRPVSPAPYTNRPVIRCPPPSKVPENGTTELPMGVIVFFGVFSMVHFSYPSVRLNSMSAVRRYLPSSGPFVLTQRRSSAEAI